MQQLGNIPVSPNIYLMIKPLLTGGLSECCRLSFPVTLLAIYLGLTADGAQVTALPEGVIVPGKGNFF